jgi:hypothetical protein
LWHEEGYQAKSVKTTKVTSKDASIQTYSQKKQNVMNEADVLQQKRFGTSDSTKQACLFEEGKKVQAVHSDKAILKHSSAGFKRNLGGLASKARVLTRGQRQMSFGPKASQGTTL